MVEDEYYNITLRDMKEENSKERLGDWLG